MKLSDFSQGRDNNFNLIRIVAALAVLVSHSYALTGRADPLATHFGISIGLTAVDLFFITSGFLVTSSLLRRQDITEFAWARILRIFPALWIVLTLSVFVLGASFTTLPLRSYFSSLKIYTYLGRCATLITGVSYNLPGVFTTNPFPSSVNGSLWTMPDEVRLYLILALTWLLSRQFIGSHIRTFKFFIGAFTCLTGICVFAVHWYLNDNVLFTRHYFMFFSGAVFYHWREDIILSHRLFWACILALFLALASGEHAFFIVYLLVITYVLLFTAYIPAGFIRQYNRLGDYSYGIYIYAFPVQQSIVALVPRISVTEMMLISFIATTSLSILSWHLLERRALEFKTYYIHHSHRLLSYGRRFASTRAG